jgi:hypothetical protein
MDCVTCASPNYYKLAGPSNCFISNGSTSNPCPLGSFLNSLTTECDFCDSNCEGCDTTAIKCTDCFPDYFLDTLNQNCI